ncbi:hypothetical protein TWF481_010208 [Arthrobotrys musiformis]|uniref:Uncharacterized protein n=1 Tax=Arthrobotrys musiformis TaxID=47236 RepID=A0AAV9W261_9PEZI
MDFINEDPRLLKHRSLPTSIFHQIPSFKSSKSKREPIPNPQFPPSPTSSNGSKKSSRLSRLKSKFSKLHSSLSRTPTAKSPKPVPEFLLSPSSGRINAEQLSKIIRRTSDPSQTDYKSLFQTQIPTADWPRFPAQLTSRPRHPTVPTTNTTPVSRRNSLTHHRTPTNSPRTRSPARSFVSVESYATPVRHSNVNTRASTPDESVCSSSAIYRLTSPTKFWETVHKRGEKKKKRDEEARRATQPVSVCKRLRMEKFKPRGDGSSSSSGSSVWDDGAPRQHKLLFPEMLNYHEIEAEVGYETEDEGGGEQDVKSLDPHVRDLLEERYYSQFEDGDSVDVVLGEREEFFSARATPDPDNQSVDLQPSVWEILNRVRMAVYDVLENMVWKPAPPGSEEEY